MLHGADHDVLLELVYDICKGDCPVVSKVVLLTFLEYGCNIYMGSSSVLVLVRGNQRSKLK